MPAMSSPGSTPAAYRRGTDSCAAAPYTIIGMLGGMMMSIAPTAVMRPAEKRSG